MKRAILFIPLILLIWLVLGFAWRLVQPADPTIRSQLVEKAVPEFALPAALPGKPTLRSADLADGRPRLLNLFASWCGPCIAEASVLRELRRQGVAIDGIAIRDRPEALAAFLDRHGDPYDRIGSDRNSAVQLALGSVGVPETFIVDGKGVIRYQYIGAIQPADVPRIIAELEKAR